MSTIPSLRIVGGPVDPQTITDLFHRVNKLLPEEQKLSIVRPTTTVGEAIRLMKNSGFAQLPVVENGEVLGLFSYRSFASEVVSLDCKKHNPAEMPVEEFMEIVGPTHFASLNDEFQSIFSRLDKDDAVLIGKPEQLQGIVTAMDVLWYLYRIAHPYVLVAEIELAIRALIRRAVDDQAFSECIRRSLHHFYEEKKLPQCIEDMTFKDYVQVIGHGVNWKKYFANGFGGMRERARARLEEIRVLRNDLFHLRQITLKDHEQLSSYRDWVLMLSRKADSLNRGEPNDG